MDSIHYLGDLDTQQHRGNPDGLGRVQGRCGQRGNLSKRHDCVQLGSERGPDARSKAQAILDDALAELRRLDDSHRELARDVYMRGHSAAERVEDELDEGDEPGLAKLRADEDAMKAELQRIYGVTDDP